MLAEGLAYGLRMTNAGRALTQNELKQADEAMAAQKAERHAIKKEGGQAPPMDYTDPRSPDAMHFAGKDLRSITPGETDRLYVGSGNKKGFYSERDAISVQADLKRDYGVDATAVETAPGQWQLRVDSVPSGKSLEEMRPIVEDLHETALRGEVKKEFLGITGPEEAARVKAQTGEDILLHRRTLDSRDIEHAIERHNKQAMAIGEKPITLEDIARYEEIVSNPDVIRKGIHPGSIIYEKRYPDGTLYITEQQLKNNKIEFRSMYKNEVAENMRSSLIITSPARTKGERVEDGE